MQNILNNCVQKIYSIGAKKYHLKSTLLKYRIIEHFLELSYPILIRIVYKDDYQSLKKNKKYMNLHLNQRCFIVGNGPSANNFDPVQFQDDVVFTVNKAYLNNNYENFHPKYHLFADSNFFDSSHPDALDGDITRYLGRENHAPESIFIIMSFNGQNNVNIKSYISKLDVSFQHKVAYIITSPIMMKLSYVRDNISSIIPSGNNIIHYAILCALYMGFDEIYLVGCDDCGLKNIINKRFEDPVDINAYHSYIDKNDENKTEAISTSKFRSILSMFLVTLENYNMLHQYCIKKGVKLINLSKYTIIDELDYGDLNLAHSKNRLEEKS